MLRLPVFFPTQWVISDKANTLKGKKLPEERLYNFEKKVNRQNQTSGNLKKETTESTKISSLFPKGGNRN